jgi:hypothetical protein
MTRQRAKPTVKEPPYEPCVNCNSGWVKWVDGFRMQRCQCWRAHQEKLAQLRAAK